MEVGDNSRSWTSVPNHKGIGKGIKRIFLSKDRRITRVVIGDEDDIVEVREGVKPF